MNNELRTKNYCKLATGDRQLDSTNVECSLQIHLFMQNEPKFRKSQMNVTDFITREYDKMDTWWSGKKQSQTNPNKAKFKKAKRIVTSIITKGYENKPPIRALKKQSQTSKRQKTTQNSLPKGIMKKTAISASGKTKPNKANCMPLKLAFLKLFFAVKWLVDEKRIIEEGKYERTE